MLTPKWKFRLYSIGGSLRASPLTIAFGIPHSVSRYDLCEQLLRTWLVRPNACFPLYPVLGMLVFSGVLALPFVGFALFPDALERLPSSGGWMNALKATLGFVELAGVGRVLAAALFLGLALYMTPGLLGARLGSLDAYFPPRHASDVGRLPVSSGSETAAVDDLDWNQNDVDAAMAEAKETGKPVFVDFSGYTCTNCREMEANVFPAPVVAEHLRTDFVLLRLYTDDTDKGPALQRYQQKMVGTVALPSYAVVTPEENLIVQHSGMASPEAFEAFLEEGLSQGSAAASQATSRRAGARSTEGTLGRPAHSFAWLSKVEATELSPM